MATSTGFCSGYFVSFRHILIVVMKSVRQKEHDPYVVPHSSTPISSRASTSPRRSSAAICVGTMAAKSLESRRQLILCVVMCRQILRQWPLLIPQRMDQLSPGKRSRCETHRYSCPSRTRATELVSQWPRHLCFWISSWQRRSPLPGPKRWAFMTRRTRWKPT
jgi:hypothetical protein